MSYEKFTNLLTSLIKIWLENEFEITKMLDHPNILKAVDIIYDDKKSPSILFEECSMNLLDAIQNIFFSPKKFN